MTTVADQFAAKLPNAVRGQLVTRFAPEPSGYLHIGHAKAALLNDFFAKYYDGRLLLRFDDTNPSKENIEFEQSICTDLAMLEVAFEGPSYTSDEIPRLADSMRDLLKRGMAYCDDTPVETMRAERMSGIESASRARAPEENLRIFEELVAGSDEGRRFCVRAKISMTDANKALRDPVFWRSNIETPHHRHGTRFKSYPTYDFACPLVDSWSGVTHALRANEYADRIPLYRWVQTAFEVRPVEIYEFSRLNLTNTVLSKRKLKWLVETGVVEDWDDPRFPTVRGMLRRGLSTQALMNFLLQQGPSKNTNLMTWDKLWSINSRQIDADAMRFMAVSKDTAVELLLSGVDAPYQRDRARHPARPELGTRTSWISPRLLVERDDADQIDDGEEVTLLHLGNVVIDRVDRADGHTVQLHGHLHLEGNVRATKKKLHYVASEHAFIFELREFDHVINKAAPEEGDSMADIVNRDSLQITRMVGEAALGELAENTLVQLERRGFARVDRLYDGCRAFNLIPSGKSKSMSTVANKIDAERVAKGSLATAREGQTLSKKELKRLAWHKSQAATQSPPGA